MAWHDVLANHAYGGRSLVDWVTLLVLIIATKFMGLGSEGFRQQFSLADVSLQHPYALHERVPDVLLLVLSLIVPLIGVLVLSAVHTRPFARMNTAALGLLLTLAITAVITNLVKSLVGRPRPDLLDRCQPRLPAWDEGKYHSTLVTDAICTTAHDSPILKDGFRSFPSGHSSTSFAGLVYLALCVRAALTSVVYRIAGLYAYVPAPTEPQPDPPRANEHTEPQGTVDVPPGDPLSPIAFTIVLPLVPVLVAAYVAISRTMDYRHHPTDVVAGATLGTVVALAVYHVYHPRRSI